MERKWRVGGIGGQVEVKRREVNDEMIFDGFRKRFGGYTQSAVNGYEGRLDLILRALDKNAVYCIVNQKDSSEEALEMKFQTEYESTDDFNIHAVVANKLASIVCSEAGISVCGHAKIEETEKACYCGNADAERDSVGFDKSGGEAQNGEKSAGDKTYAESGIDAGDGSRISKNVGKTKGFGAGGAGDEPKTGSGIEPTKDKPQDVFVEMLGEALGHVTGRLRPICARVLGTGGVVLKPYIADGKIYTDVIPQTRFYALETKGDTITSALFLADSFKRGGRDYMRVEVHSLGADGVYRIEQFALCNMRRVSLAETGVWAELEPIVEFENVDAPLFAFLRCPVDGRRDFKNPYGVPVTFGCDKIVQELKALLEQTQREFELKKAFVGSDIKLFDENDDLVRSGLYKRFSDSGFGIGDKPFWEVFSPEIRHESYLSAVDFKLAQLEKAIGVNKGVLTDLDSVDATATAIRRSTFDTFNLTDAMREEIERACRALVRAYEVMISAFGLAEGASEDWSLGFDWSYDLIEDTAETFEQLMSGYNAGIVTEDEVRRFLFD